MNKFSSQDEYPSSESTKMSINECFNRIRDGLLKRPDYQRELIWNKKQQQAYLTSLCRGIPLFGPVININTETGDQTIMDGQNRIMTLIQFLSDEISFENEDDEKIKFSDIPFNEQRKIKNTKISYIETRDWSKEQCQEFFITIQGGEKLKDGEMIHAKPNNLLTRKILEIFTIFGDLFTNKAKDSGMGLTPEMIKRYGHYEIIGTLIHMIRTNEYPLRPGKTALAEFYLWSEEDHPIILELESAVELLSQCLTKYSEIMMNVPRLRAKVKKEEHLRLLYFIFKIKIYQSEFNDEIYSKIERILNRVLNKDNPEYQQIITWGTGGAENIYDLYHSIYNE